MAPRTPTKGSRFSTHNTSIRQSSRAKGLRSKLSLKENA